ncbi:unnamed protein product [Oppiella nova]|uniref:F-box domain-containing protein n=1 Tax=Oppiella nova TaxID=334625 RepID=A0A7R9MGJ5_9ACAR|nr:unnamed protein product [Oppiella nova]CAG2176660.1 unnamed protein product [Oppiella nova]
MAHKKLKTEKNGTTDKGKDSEQPQMDAKDSLDRFSDDLCQHLLSYLSLEDRFRCECVSKQWQRVIYETIDEIIINDNLLDKMKTKNCANIETIDCRYVRSKLQRQVFEAIDELLDNCLNVRQIDCDLIYGLDSVFDETGNQCLAKNLQKYEFGFGGRLFADHFTDHMFTTFVANNKSLKSLNIKCINGEIEETVIGFMNRLSQLQELRELKLEFTYECDNIEYSISEPLAQIGLKCAKLKRFCLTMVSQTPEPNVGVLNAIQLMPQITRLELNLGLPSDDPPLTDWQSFDSLKRWPKLTHLSLNLWQINYKLFQEIAANEPNLRSLDMEIDSWSYGQINAFCLDRMASLRKLQSLAIRWDSDANLNLNESDIKAFVLKSSPKLKSFRLIAGKCMKYTDKRIHEMRNMLPLNH